MTLLVSFLCRFGWGMAVGLLLTPSSDVPAGFFRVNLLVVMGLATLAALAAASLAAMPAHADWAGKGELGGVLARGEASRAASEASATAHGPPPPAE